MVDRVWQGTSSINNMWSVRYYSPEPSTASGSACFVFVEFNEGTAKATVMARCRPFFFSFFPFACSTFALLFPTAIYHHYYAGIFFLFIVLFFFFPCLMNLVLKYLFFQSLRLIWTLLEPLNVLLSLGGQQGSTMEQDRRSPLLPSTTMYSSVPCQVVSSAVNVFPFVQLGFSKRHRVRCFTLNEVDVTDRR